VKNQSPIFAIEIGSLKTSRFANHFTDPHIKKIILVGRLQHQGGIGTVTGPADGNNIIAGQGAGVCRHHCDFYRNFDALAKEP
jgi:hypothetical protein